MVNSIIILSHIPILAACFSALRLYATLGKSLRLFTYFIFFSGIIQALSLLLCYSNINNMPLLHIYVAGGLPLLLWFYRTLLKGFVTSRIMVVTAVAFTLFTLCNSLFIQDIFRFNSNALAAESVIIIILALFTYIFLLNDTMKETGIPDKKSLFWINSGLFLYYLSCLLIFYFGDTILFRFSRDLSRLTWLFHSFFSIVMYTCITIGLWKRSRTQHS